MEPVFHRPGEGEVLPGAHRTIYVRYEGPEYEVLEFFCEPGFGPIEPHAHEGHVDSFYVLDGEVEFTIGDEVVRAGPGTWVAAPPGVRHGFAIPGPEGAHFLNIHAPGSGFIDRVRRAQMAEPIVVRAGEGEVVADTPKRTLRILTDHELLNLTWFRYEPGEDGPDPHVHYTHSDAFYVLEGEIELRLGPDVEPHSAPAGTLGAAPPNLVHTFRNSSDATAIFINVHAPGAGFADMMRARRDGRHREAAQFDQHDPPADGGRPLTDALLATPREGDAQDPDGNFSLIDAEVPPGHTQSFVSLNGSRVTAVFVLEGAVSIGEAELAPGDFALADGEPVLVNPTNESARCAVFIV